MTAPVLSPDAERELSDVLMSALRADADLQSRFGTPARIFDDETDRSAFPFIQLDGWRTEPADSAGRRGLVQTVTFVVQSRAGGFAEARRLLGALRSALDGLDLSLTTQRVILIQTVFSDVVRASDLQHFRGVVRARLVTEARQP